MVTSVNGFVVLKIMIKVSEGGKEGNVTSVIKSGQNRDINDCFFICF